MSGRASSIMIASSASPASTTSKPASPITSAAFMRSIHSSSTIRTTGRLVDELSTTYLTPTLSKCRGLVSFRGREDGKPHTRSARRTISPEVHCGGQLLLVADQELCRTVASRDDKSPVVINDTRRDGIVVVWRCRGRLK